MGYELGSEIPWGIFHLRKLLPKSGQIIKSLAGGNPAATARLWGPVEDLLQALVTNPPCVLVLCTVLSKNRSPMDFYLGRKWDKAQVRAQMAGALSPVAALAKHSFTISTFHKQNY